MKKNGQNPKAILDFNEEKIRKLGLEGNFLNLRNSYKKSTTLHLIVKFKMFPQNIKKEKR